MKGSGGAGRFPKDTVVSYPLLQMAVVGTEGVVGLSWRWVQWLQKQEGQRDPRVRETLSWLSFPAFLFTVTNSLKNEGCVVAHGRSALPITVGNV